MSDLIQTNNGEVDPSKLCGWAGADSPELLREAFDLIGDQFEQIKIKGSRPITGARSMLWEVSRRVLGQDTPMYPQSIGDCVAFGAKNAIEYVQFFPIVNEQSNDFKQVFPPYLYGSGRVFVGKRALGRNSDGSLGIWQAKAVMAYGTIPIDTPGCPAYSGKIARAWGYDGPPQNFVDVGKTYLIKSAALVKTWEDVVTALVNGYPVTVASNVGFTMQPQSSKFHERAESWAHQMCIIGVDNEATEPYACILNSWGNSHGTVIDFKSGEKWPVGTLRVRKKDIELMLREGDSFAYSAFDGFPAQKLPRSFFDFI